MPELPEVELVRRGLTATITGRRLQAIEVRSPSSLALSAVALKRSVVGHRVDRVARRGKVLILDLDSGDHLLVHLMMTGQMVVVEGGRTLFAGGHPSRSMLGPMPNLTTRIIFGLDGKRTLYFNDGRKFGRIRLLDSAALATDPFLTRLGPEPLEDTFTLAGFRAQLRRHRRAPIKAVILDQAVVAGIGNIYADESLHLARVHPAQRAGDLRPPEVRGLHDAIVEIIGTAIQSGGTSFAGNVDPARPPAGYLARARVFHRQGEPCMVCGTAIERTRVAGRGTNFCPHCQADDRSRGQTTRTPDQRAGARRAIAV